MENKDLVIQNGFEFEVSWEMLFCLAGHSERAYSVTSLIASFHSGHCPPPTLPFSPAFQHTTRSWGGRLWNGGGWEEKRGGGGGGGGRAHGEPA